MKRECFIEGYNQAVKEMYDWLDKNLKMYISYHEQSEKFMEELKHKI